MRWVIAGIAGYIIYILVRNELRKHTARKEPLRADMPDAAKGGDMVQDPICGAYVAVAASVSVRDGKTVHRFCSYECRDAYLERLRNEGREIPRKREPGE